MAKKRRPQAEIDAGNGVQIEFAQEKTCDHCRKEFTGPAILGFLSRDTMGAISLWYHIDCIKLLRKINIATKAKCKVSKERIGNREHYALGGIIHILPEYFNQLINTTSIEAYEQCLRNSKSRGTTNYIILDLPLELIKKYKFEKERRKLEKREEKKELAIQKITNEILGDLGDLNQIKVRKDFYIEKSGVLDSVWYRLDVVMISSVLTLRINLISTNVKASSLNKKACLRVEETLNKREDIEDMRLCLLNIRRCRGYMDDWSHSQVKTLEPLDESIITLKDFRDPLSTMKAAYSAFFKAMPKDVTESDIQGFIATTLLHKDNDLRILAEQAHELLNKVDKVV